MIDLLLFTWAWLLYATFLEAQAVQVAARTTVPPKQPCRCRYIMKENQVAIGGDANGS